MTMLLIVFVNRGLATWILFEKQGSEPQVLKSIRKNNQVWVREADMAFDCLFFVIVSEVRQLLQFFSQKSLY